MKRTRLLEGIRVSHLKYCHLACDHRSLTASLNDFVLSAFATSFHFSADRFCRSFISIACRSGPIREISMAELATLTIVDAIAAATARISSPRVDRLRTRRSGMPQNA